MKQAETKIKETGKEPWTGDYYVSFGEGATRNWEDARRYGFVSGGGGAWYSRTLSMSHPGSRVLVHIPGRGYVGVGEVIGDRVKAMDLMVDADGHSVRLTEAPGVKGSYVPTTRVGEDESTEYAVPVKWLKTVPPEQGYRENGILRVPAAISRFGGGNRPCPVPDW